MKNQDILSEINRQSGMTVPEGYFSNFAARMAQTLPEQPWEKPNVMPRTFWHKVRPYVYMAAMFLGVWCMMKTFDLMRPKSDLSIGNNPILVSAISNDSFFNDYCAREIDETDLYDDLYNQGFDPNDMLSENE